MSNFSFFYSVFERLVLQTCKNKGLFGKGLLHHSDLFQLHHIANSKVTDCWRLDKVCKGLSFNFPSSDCSISCSTHYQMTNCRLFQTESVCRRQFQIQRKWQQVIQMGRKHCGKKRNCSLQAISSFPTVFLKGLFPRGVKRCHCVG